MSTIIIIPARLSSTRLPNKVLLDLNGKSVVQRVYEQCLKAKKIDKVFIATDSKKVYDSCFEFTSNVLITKETHQSGTDRIAEAVKDIACNIVLNVQGDEPFIDPKLIDSLVDSFTRETVMSSAIHILDKVEDLKNQNVVKVTIDKNNNALYFSRSIIPYYRDYWNDLLENHVNIPKELRFYRHLGIYAYKKDFLLKYSNMEQSYLEQLEKLEQLRVIENGYKIKMIETTYNSIGIDTQKDYEKALELINDIE